MPTKCQVWPLSKITQVVGPLGYHWTQPYKIRSIRRLGLGSPVSDWWVEGNESLHLYCLLSGDRKGAIDEQYGYAGIRFMEFARAVLDLYREQHPDAYQVWISKDTRLANSWEMGEALIEIRLDDVSRLKGHFFPDGSGGWSVITYGKRISPKSFYVFTKADLREEGLIGG